LFLLLGLVFRGLVPAGAQSSGEGAGVTAGDDSQGEAVPVLVSGPTADKGLPFLSANAIEYYRGLYELPSQNVRVYYTRRAIVPLSSWKPASCGDYELLTFRADPEDFPDIRADDGFDMVPGGPLVAFYEGKDYSLFFSYGGAVLSCAFVNEFIRKFLFFSNNAGRGGFSGERGASPQQTRFPPPQFPAVLR